MKKHLSDRQFAKCLVGRPSRLELQHVGECSKCAMELDRTSNSISLFRRAIRGSIENRVALDLRAGFQFSPKFVTQATPKWRWALVAAGIVAFATVPMFTRKEEPPPVIEEMSTQLDPDALMNAVNLHLSRAIPEAMEPVMALIPTEESITESGEIR